VTHTPPAQRLQGSGQPPPVAPASLAQWLWHDRLLVGALVISGLLITYQVWVTLAAPSWGAGVTNWVRVVLAWQAVVLLLLLSGWLTRTHRPEALSWWLLSISMLGYALGKTLQVVLAQVVFHRALPFPWWPDLLALVAFPGFFLAPILWPSVAEHQQAGLARAKAFLDTLLVMGAVTTLSWYFFLAPLFLRTSASWQTRVVELAYPVADLGGCFALLVVLLRPSRDLRHGVILRLLLLTAGCLILADSLSLWLRLYAPSQPEAVPNLVYVLATLLLPLAGLVQYRLALHKPWVVKVHVKQQELSLQQHDLRRCFWLVLPFGAVVLVAVVLEAQMWFAPIAASGRGVPHLLILLLLLLALTRQAVGFLDYIHIQREGEADRANVLALCEANRRMEEFLGIVSHELKTPLTSLQGNTELLVRRITAVHGHQAEAEDLARLVAMVQAVLERSTHSLRRISLLVDDLLDVARIREGHLELRLEPCDLAVVVQEAVDEQRTLADARTVHLELPAMHPVLVLGDADRLGQVVTNYMTNALKYSRADRPIEVCLQVEGGVARVLVRDEGIGLPADQQAHVWDLFYRASGVAVQYGSGVGMGIGLHVCKTIIARLHGQVGVESQAGQGSTFWFSLPLAAAPI
jgi:signal transduction histidine kinase